MQDNQRSAIAYRSGLAARQGRQRVFQGTWQILELRRAVAQTGICHKYPVGVGYAPMPSFKVFLTPTHFFAVPAHVGNALTALRELDKHLIMILNETTVHLEIDEP